MKENNKLKDFYSSLATCSNDNSLLAEEIYKILEKGGKLERRNDLFKRYHFALVNENVINIAKQSDGIVRGEIHANLRQDNPTHLTSGAHQIWTYLNKKSNWKTIKYAKMSVAKGFGEMATHDGANKEVRLEENELQKENVPASNEDIDEFFGNLVFAIHLPNEVQLGNYLKSEIRTYFKVFDGSDLQLSKFLELMLDWFKDSKSSLMTRDKGNTLLDTIMSQMNRLRVEAASIDYQEQELAVPVNHRLVFISDENIKALLTASVNPIALVTTSSTKITAIKVRSTLLQLSNRFLMLKSSYFASDLVRYTVLVVEAMKSFDSQHILVIVYDTNVQLNYLFEQLSLKQKGRSNKIVIISNDFDTEEIKKSSLNGLLIEEFKDTINFQQLERPTEFLTNTFIHYLGNSISLSELLINPSDEAMDVDDSESQLLNLAKDVIDSKSLIELLEPKTELVIDLLDSSSVDFDFDKTFYINRFLHSPLLFINDRNSLQMFIDILVRVQPNFKCKVKKITNDKRAGAEVLVTDKKKSNAPIFKITTGHGSVEWLSPNEQRKQVWDILLEATKQYHSISAMINSDDTKENINEKKFSKLSTKVAIISDVAGTGKSTLLTQLTKQMTSLKDWIIRINLRDHSKAIRESDLQYDNPKKVLDFLAKDLIKLKSHFAKRLLVHFLQSSSSRRFVLMLDGYDEINSQNRKKIINLAQSLISDSKISTVYITTRPQFVEELEREFNQFAFTLKDFSMEEQITYLTNHWVSTGNHTIAIQHFAKTLISKVTRRLNERERSFSGVPLQTRMLAECYRDELIKYLSQVTDDQPLNETILDSLFDQLIPKSFNLFDLYSQFVDTKWKILRNEKEKISLDNLYSMQGNDAKVRELRLVFYQLAIKTMFIDEKDVEILWRDDHRFQLTRDIHETAHTLGLTGKSNEDEDDLQFFHRTFAEFYLAEYLADALDEKNSIRNSRHPLLNEQDGHDLLIKRILSERNDYQMTRLFLNEQVSKFSPFPTGNGKLKLLSDRLGVLIANSTSSIQDDQIYKRFTSRQQDEQCFGLASFHIQVIENLNHIFHLLLVLLEASDHNQNLTYNENEPINENYSTRFRQLVSDAADEEIQSCEWKIPLLCVVKFIARL